MQKKFFLLFLFLTLSIGSANALEIVYPKSKNVIINSDKTFFIGNEKNGKFLTINNEPVKLHSSGGFKHTVSLNYGINQFKISNGTKNFIYNITRPKKVDQCNNELKIRDFGTSFMVEIVEDKSPLRSTPVDSGLNRLGHLQNGTNLIVTGEYEDFYRVKLSRDDNAWISKKNVVKIDKLPEFSGKIIATDYITNDNEDVFIFSLNNKVPYVLSEDNLSGYTLTLYAMDNDLYSFGRYEFQIAHEGKNFGYSSYFTDKNELIVKIKKYKKSLKGLHITLDPGHGGKEFGAIGCLGDKEKDINLQIAIKLKQKLENAGAVVYMTRIDDSYISLNDRVKISNSNDSDIFISIHNNALSDFHADDDASGTEVYYFYPQSRYLAKVVSSILSEEVGFKNRGAKGESFAVIRNSNVPAILVESGFMINPEENSLLIKSDFQDKIAEGILKGLKKYFEGIDWEVVRGK